MIFHFHSFHLKRLLSTHSPHSPHSSHSPHTFSFATLSSTSTSTSTQPVTTLPSVTRAPHAPLSSQLSLYSPTRVSAVHSCDAIHLPSIDRLIVNSTSSLSSFLFPEGLRSSIHLAPGVNVCTVSLLCLYCVYCVSAYSPLHCVFWVCIFSTLLVSLLFERCLCSLFVLSSFSPFLIALVIFTSSQSPASRD